MSRIIISSNVDSRYFYGKHDDWIKSVLKNSSENMHPLIITSGFSPENISIDSAFIDLSSLSHSVQTHASGNRKNFTCLETGEFVKFLDLEDDDIFILCDYDVTMQRPMKKEEIDTLLELGSLEFAVSRDDYSGIYNLLWFFNNFSKSEIFKDIDPSWHQYNTGIQAGRVSAWKNLFRSWKEVSDLVTSNIPYHFAFQLFFSYFVQKNKILVDAGPLFHNAHWFRDTPAKVCQNKNMLVLEDEAVLFYHHKFKNRPSF